jgi:hypothetical protein
VRTSTQSSMKSASQIADIPLPFKQLLLRGLMGCLLGTLITILNLFLIARIFPSNRQVIEPFAFWCCGLIAGAIHGGFLRRLTRPALLWLLFSGAGWSVAGLIDSHNMLEWSSTRQIVINALFLGGLVALPQASLLLSRSLRLAILWPVLSASSWALVLLAIDWQGKDFNRMINWFADLMF